MKTSFLIGIAAMVLGGCEKPNKFNRAALNLEEVKALICGHYEGEYAKGTEYFEIRSDGTFSQTFVQTGATNYVAGGVWGFERMQDRHLVTFKPFMDLSNAIVDGKNPESGTGRVATFYEDEPRIYFSRDLSYFIVRLSGEARTGKVAK